MRARTNLHANVIVALLLVASSWAQKSSEDACASHQPPRESRAWQDMSPCWKASRDQRSREECAWKDLNTVEDEMNSAYRELLQKYRKQPVIQESIRAAQRSWIRYRDAFVGSYFPDLPSVRTDWGSQMAECSVGYRIAITNERTYWLRQMVDPLACRVETQERSDVCPFPY